MLQRCSATTLQRCNKQPIFVKHIYLVNIYSIYFLYIDSVNMQCQYMKCYTEFNYIEV